MVKMVDETKRKILDASLKVFAREGYKSATTRSIANESGFSEITLFRKFETKKKLFDEAMRVNHEKLQENCITIIEDLNQKFEEPEQFLREYIKRMAIFFKENFEFFNMMVTEDNLHIDVEMGNFSVSMGEFIARNIKNSCCNISTIAITINTFIYILNLEISHGLNKEEFDNLVAKFTNNMLNCLK